MEAGIALISMAAAYLLGLIHGIEAAQSDKPQQEERG